MPLLMIGAAALGLFYLISRALPLTVVAFILASWIRTGSLGILLRLAQRLKST
jgi:hypothetical protein